MIFFLIKALRKKLDPKKSGDLKGDENIKQDDIQSFLCLKFFSTQWENSHNQKTQTMSLFMGMGGINI